MKSKGILVSGEFLSVQHLVTAVRPIWTYCQSSTNPTAAKFKECWSSLSLLMRQMVEFLCNPMMKKLLKAVSLEDKKMFLLFKLLFIRQMRFLSCTWGKRASVANHIYVEYVSFEVKHTHMASVWLAESHC